MNTPNTPNAPQPWALPPMPPRPSDTPPPQDPDGSKTRAWEASWRIFWQAAAVHQTAADVVRVNAAAAAGATSLKAISLAETILRVARFKPRYEDERVTTWAKRVKTHAEALYAEMPAS
jgi:hypothetical protein